MQITINGQLKEFEDKATLTDIVKHFAKSSNHIITEVNGDIIKNHSWEKTTINDNDTIELIAFMGGG